MHCIENPFPPVSLALVLTAAALLAGCANKSGTPAAPPPPAAPAARTAPQAPAARTPLPTPPAEVPAPAPQPTAPVAAALPGMRVVRLPPPTPSRSMGEVRSQAARRLVAAHPDHTYMSVPKQPLMGVPVLKVMLNADGSVNNIIVLREPQEQKQTIQMAIDAVHRAAPYGDLSQVPRPWEFIETFLFEWNGRFKPMTLDRPEAPTPSAAPASRTAKGVPAPAKAAPKPKR